MFEPMDEQQHVALPQLYGAPAYARPAVPVAHTPRPVTPDDLPIAAEMTDDEVQLLAMLPELGDRVPATPGGGVATVPSRPEASPQPRPFSIRALADRILRSSR